MAHSSVRWGMESALDGGGHGDQGGHRGDRSRQCAEARVEVVSGLIEGRRVDTLNLALTYPVAAGYERPPLIRHLEGREAAEVMTVLQQASYRPPDAAVEQWVD